MDLLEASGATTRHNHNNSDNKSNKSAMTRNWDNQNQNQVVRGFCSEGFPLPLDALDRHRYFIVTLPGLSI